MADQRSLFGEEQPAADPTAAARRRRERQFAYRQQRAFLRPLIEAPDARMDWRTCGEGR